MIFKNISRVLINEPHEFRNTDLSNENLIAPSSRPLGLINIITFTQQQ